MGEGGKGPTPIEEKNSFPKKEEEKKQELQEVWEFPIEIFWNIGANNF